MPCNRSQVARRENPYAHLRPHGTFEQNVPPGTLSSRQAQAPGDEVT